MERCDVLVVGGGPAGSTLAWALRRRGLDVMVLDKQRFPRDKVCAGWVTPAVLDSLEFDAEDYRCGRVFQPIYGFHVGLMHRPGVDARYPDGAPVSYGIRRCEFDHYLLERSGARLRLGTGLARMERHGGSWRVNGCIETPLVVGAGGHFCPVARVLGARPGRGETVVAAKEIEFALGAAQGAECAVAGERPELYFCADLKGYAWVFRKGDYLNVGLGREDNHRLGDHLDAFCDFLRASGKLPHDLPGRFKGHAYLLYPHAPRPLIGDGTLLIGDAAGLAYAQSGEGIRPAVESALLAAQVIDSAAGDYRRVRLEPYRGRMVERFGPRQPGPGWVERLPAGLRRFIAGRLLGAPWFVRAVVMDRWFLHREQTPVPAPAASAAH